MFKKSKIIDVEDFASPHRIDFSFNKRIEFITKKKPYLSCNKTILNLTSKY